MCLLILRSLEVAEGYSLTVVGSIFCRAATAQHVLSNDLLEKYRSEGILTKNGTE